MNYLLYQPACLSEQDRIYFNGILVEDVLKREAIYDQIIKIFSSVENSTNPWLGNNGGFFVVRGMFDAKDDKGRQLAFIFASDSPDYKNELLSIVKNIGYEMELSTKNLVFLSSYSNRYNKYIYLSILGVLVFVFILLLLLLL